MRAAYFWPVVGEQDEICFLYYPSRAAKHVETALGLQRPNGAVWQSDGYSAYEHYAKKTGGHTRARFFAWIDEQFDKQGFLPSSPFLGALAYIREEMFAENPLRSDLHDLGGRSTCGAA